MKTPFPSHRLVEQLHVLGVARGAVLLVHTAFSRVGPVKGGPRALIAALREALGPEGTLAMPSLSDPSFSATTATSICFPGAKGGLEGVAEPG